MVSPNYRVVGFRPVGESHEISEKFGAGRALLAQRLGLKRTYHTGVDFRCPVRTEVHAFLDGTVQMAGESEGYGTRIWIYHDLPRRARAIRSCYAHLLTILVKPGDVVKEGQLIAYSGQSGKVTGPHLHFETRYLPEDEPFEPEFYKIV